MDTFRIRRFWKDFDAQLADLTLHADIYGVGYR